MQFLFRLIAKNMDSWRSLTHHFLLSKTFVTDSIKYFTCQPTILCTRGWRSDLISRGLIGGSSNQEASPKVIWQRRYQHSFLILHASREILEDMALAWLLAIELLRENGGCDYAHIADSTWWGEHVKDHLNKRVYSYRKTYRFDQFLTCHWEFLT